MNEPDQTPVPDATNVAEPTVAAAPEPTPAPIPDPIVPPVTSTPSSNNTNLTKPRSGGRMWLLLLLLLIVIAGGLAVVYKYGQTKNTPTAVVEKDVALVRVGIPEPLPTTLYPNVDDGSFVQDIDSQAFEGLTQFTDLTKVTPDLAVSWTNPDSSTWVFKLRSGVKFHTGRTMTATDVKDSLDDIQNFSLGPEYGSTIKAVTVIDPLTVQITTNGPDPILPNELVNLFIYDTTSTTLNSPVNGTGPYTLKTGTKIGDNNAVDLTAFDNYWGGRPHVQEVQYISEASDTDAMAAFQAGKLDVAGVLTQPNAQKIVNANSHQLVIQAPTVAQLVPNTLNGSPLSKLAVREALMQALDVNQIMKVRGIVGTPATQIVAPSIPGYDPVITRPSYDPTAAKAALAAAGYPNGFSFTLTYFGSAQVLADEVKRQLAIVGVTVKEDPQTDADTLIAKVFGGQTDMYYNALSTSLVDASDFISPLFGKNYANAATQQLFTESSQTIDPAKRLQLLQQVSDKLVQDRADLPLYVFGNTYYVAPNNLVMSETRITGDMGINFNLAYGK